MIVEDQTSTVAFLKRAFAHNGGRPVEIIETHISLVFLVDDRAFKMKRAVKLPYADFSTAELRLAACRTEVELNSRTAPSIYLGVRRITREGEGQLAFDGAGAIVDAVVEMVRFEQDRLFDRLAVEGRLSPAIMTEVARAISKFHRTAPAIHAGSGEANIGKVLDINEAGFATSQLFSSDEVKALNTSFRKALVTYAEHLDRRELAGKIRRCHGDLHLRNICLLDDGPKLFDCIEFNEQIATIDVLYDLAFLLMDLWHRQLFGFANIVMNRYLDESGEEGGFTLLPFFMAIRAAIRAHVTATQIEESGQRVEELVQAGRSYMDLARDLLNRAAPCLIAIGGLSGSGKSTVAELLAPQLGDPPGARFLETDRIRKAMFGVSAETRLGHAAYEPGVSERVYQALARRSADIVRCGGTVVAAAVFDRPDDRVLIEQSARENEGSFIGFWLDADASTLRERVGGRHGGSSDATSEVLEKQLKRNTGEIRWRWIDAGASASEVAKAILASIVEQ